MKNKIKKINLKRVKAYRTLYAFYQKEMAEELGITLQSYNMKENGKCEFTSTEIGIMANKFGVDPGEFFKEAGVLC